MRVQTPHAIISDLSSIFIKSEERCGSLGGWRGGNQYISSQAMENLSRNRLHHGASFDMARCLKPHCNNTSTYRHGLSTRQRPPQQAVHA